MSPRCFRRRCRGLGLGATLALAAGLQARFGRAQPSCGSSEADAPALVVRLTGECARPDLRAALCDWLEAEPWQASFEQNLENESDGRAMLSIARHDGGVTLRLTQAKRAPVERVLAPIDRLTTSAVELIAQSAQSLLRVAALMPTAPSQAGPSEGKQPPWARSQAVRAAPAWALGAEYQGRVRGPEPLTHGPRLRAEARLPGRTQVWTTAGVFSSTTARVAGVALSLRGVAFGAGVGWRGRAGPIELPLDAGYVLELTQVDLGASRDPTLAPLPAGPWRSRHFASLGLAPTLTAGAWQWGIVLDLSFQLNPSPYRILEEDSRETRVAAAWKVQPGAALRIAYALR